MCQPSCLLPPYVIRHAHMLCTRTHACTCTRTYTRTHARMRFASVGGQVSTAVAAEIFYDVASAMQTTIPVLGCLKDELMRGVYIDWQDGQVRWMLCMAASYANTCVCMHACVCRVHLVHAQCERMLCMHAHTGADSSACRFTHVQFHVHLGSCVYALTFQSRSSVCAHVCLLFHVRARWHTHAYVQARVRVGDGHSISQRHILQPSRAA